MFADTWRAHWGLKEEPFVHEDADKDPVLARLDSTAVHSSFDRLFGDPTSPVPGVVFGEKGSGKSSLRRTMKRRLLAYNEAHPDKKAFVVEYIDFDPFLESLRRHLNIAGGTKKTTPKLLEQLSRSDHLDAVLSLAVTRLVNETIQHVSEARRFDRKHRRDLVTLAHLYYRSDLETRGEAMATLQKALGWFSGRPMLLQFARTALTVVGVILLLLPHLGVLGAIIDRFEGWQVRFPSLSHIVGGILVAGTWLWTLGTSTMLYGKARRTTQAIRVVPGAARPLAKFLATLPPAARNEIALPQGGEEESRFLMLKRLLGVLRGAGYASLYVLVDRVDESTYLEGRAETMQAFVEPLLDHKLLQFEGLGLKLFLPIELSRLTVHASNDDLKRMRLDKANTVQELIWTGQELLAIANQRLAAATHSEASPRLPDFFGEGVQESEIRDALHTLGTPRLCFGFLGSLFTEHARDLPEAMDAEDPRWKIPQRLFDIQRAAWTDRARTLRRTLN
ncbi:MAG: hypothetical protein H6830_10570 [Planctomycetes bacterium]|nr:hypothetical protein [Planctomycetota bacterium]